MLGFSKNLDMGIVIFFKINSPILSFLYNYLNKQINDSSSYSMLILIHSDLYYFNNWVRFELLPMIEYQFTDCVANEDKRNNIKLLIEKSTNSSIENLENLSINLLNKTIINRILNESTRSLREVDELAHSWQVNSSLMNNDDDDNNNNSIVSQKVSEYVIKLFKPLKEFLMFVNNHSLEHITMGQK